MLLKLREQALGLLELAHAILAETFDFCGLALGGNYLDVNILLLERVDRGAVAHCITAIAAPRDKSSTTRETKFPVNRWTRLAGNTHKYDKKIFFLPFVSLSAKF